MAVEVTKVESPEVKSDKKMVDSPPRPKGAPVSMPETLGQDTRDRLYKAYNDLDSAADAVKTEEVTPPKDESAEALQDAVTESGKEVGDQDLPKDQRTVNYGALKEEREKRKAAQQRETELQKQVEFLIDENKLFMELLQSSGAAKKQTEKEKVPEIPDGDNIDDYDQELITHRKTIKELKRKLDEFEGKSKAVDVEEAKKKLDGMLKSTAERLEAEGFPGFESLTPLVSKELYAIGDPKLDNPEGWMKIYKEKVYPHIYGKTVPPIKEDTDPRRSAKEAAARTRPSVGGRPPVPQERTSGLSSFEEYMLGRRKNFPGIRGK
jgi:hypothetical protein